MRTAYAILVDVDGSPIIKSMGPPLQTVVQLAADHIFGEVPLSDQQFAEIRELVMVSMAAIFCCGGSLNKTGRDFMLARFEQAMIDQGIRIDQDIALARAHAAGASAH
jgi:hypothetical protein